MYADLARKLALTTDIYGGPSWTVLEYDYRERDWWRRRTYESTANDDNWLPLALSEVMAGVYYQETRYPRYDPEYYFPRQAKSE